MTRFTRHGHAVRCEGDPFATCVDETAAMMVLNALRALEDADGWVPVCGMPEPTEIVHIPTAKPRGEPIDVGDAFERISARYPKILARLAEGPRCYQRRECDEHVCSCGLRWGVDEDDPHG